MPNPQPNPELGKLIGFIRPDDWELFSLNKDGETFSLESSKKRWRAALHHKYSAARLRTARFHEVYESAIPYTPPAPRNCGG